MVFYLAAKVEGLHYKVFSVDLRCSNKPVTTALRPGTALSNYPKQTISLWHSRMCPLHTSRAPGAEDVSAECGERKRRVRRTHPFSARRPRVRFFLPGGDTAFRLFRRAAAPSARRPGWWRRGRRRPLRPGGAACAVQPRGRGSCGRSGWLGTRRRAML